MSNYPDDWPAIAERVKSEAGWRCVRCLHPDAPALCEGQGLPRGQACCDDLCEHEGARFGRPPEKQRILTVHHLDGDKSNCRWWNIPPLCQACHLSVQGKVRMEQTYAEPHSDWFLPYVAGYYAETVGGMELSREAVEARLPELLALGQPHLEEHYRRRLAA